MFHPSELKAIKAFKEQARKAHETLITKAQARIVLLDHAYGVAYPNGNIDKVVNLATAQYIVRTFNNRSARL